MIERIKGYFSKDEEYEDGDYEEYEEEDDDSEDDYDYDDEPEKSEDLGGFGDDLFKKDNKKKLSVVLMSPDTFNDSIRISDELKRNKMVIVNLEDIDFEEARKIVDFVSGTVYALGGSINKISSKIVAFSPIFVDVQNTITVRRKDKGMDIPNFRKI
ncbi:MAG: cell division protein SepF [Firmicutes bacterium]|nr:cell division protein SepF [Bacillota bacterium]